MKIKRGDETLTIPATLPLLPLRDVVVFPHMIIPLLVGREPSIAALQEAMTGDRLLFVTAQEAPDIKEPGQKDLHRIGVVAKVLQLLPLPDGTRKILIEGMVRARLVRLMAAPKDGKDRQKQSQHAKIQVLSDVEEANPEIEALQRSVAEQFSDYVRMNRRIPDEVLMSVVSLEDPSQLADTIAAHLISKLPVKQQVLASMDLTSRFRALSEVLGEELEILQIEARIEGEIKSSVQKSQKEMYLNERLKAIRKELGYEDDPVGSELEELAEAIENARMSKEATEIAFKELDRLSKMAPLSPESAVVRTWLENLTSLPWKKQTRDRLDIARVKAQLDADHYGLDRVKDRILEYISVMKLTKSMKGPILCLAGPPGVGKTSLGRSIATALGRKFVRVSLGGVRDEAEIRGHRRTYIGSMPGRIIQGLKRAESRNPVFLLDEIDKLGSDFRGDPSSALLEALDPEQNAHFSDHYCEVPFDLSRVFFITTANVLDNIPPALRDRLEIIQLHGYLDHEKTAIARDFLLPKQMKEHGVSEEQLAVREEALDLVVQRYTRESGVRQLERCMGGLCRKVARRLVEGTSRRRVKSGNGNGSKTKSNGKRSAPGIRIDPGKVGEYLGVPPYSRRELDVDLEVGVATGLAWTAVGGEILPIEVTLMGGRGELILTGQLGDVMKESARAALSYVRSVATRLGAPKNVFEKNDVHIHVPEGAIPKDGPSAGLAMAAALVSAVTGRPIQRRVGLTGEITLRGRALPIGGLNEKAMAAQRAGVGKILVPADNAKDIDELPAKIKTGLEIVTVSHMDEVLDHVLAKRPRRSTRSVGRAANYTH